jgi:Spy/CpxP family protein refolding chaperone
MKKIIVTGLCLGVALVFITAALAWGPDFSCGFGPGSGSGPGYPAIPDLTAEQSTRIKALQDAFLNENDVLLKDMAAKGQELRGSRFIPGSDAVAFRAKQKEMFDLRAKLQEKRNGLRDEVRKIITPEQLAPVPAFGPGLAYGSAGGLVPAAEFGHRRMGPRGRR